MLTFRFTGADGIMVEEETLTAGMVKKEVKLEFSSEWDNMTKTAVFSAGAVTRSVVGVSDVAVIPAEVLAKPLQELYVGVYGVARDGKVTPTIRVKGPEIKPGTDPSYDKGTDPDLAIWAQLQQEIDALKEYCINGEHDGYYIPTVTKTDVNTVQISFVPSLGSMPELEPVIITLPGSDSGQNPTGGGLSATASALLINILRNAVYTADQSANITALENALFDGGTAPDVPDVPDTPDEPDVPVVTYYTIVNVLTNVTNSNSTAKVAEGESYKATLAPTDGYNLDTVTVTMGGVNVTADVYADGTITIESVTGNVIITASAVENSATAPAFELTSPLVLGDTTDPRINDTANCRIATGETVNDDEDWTVCVDFTSLAGARYPGEGVYAFRNENRQLQMGFSAPSILLAAHGNGLASYNDYQKIDNVACLAGKNLIAVVTWTAATKTYNLYGTKENTVTLSTIGTASSGQLYVGSTESVGTFNRFALYKRILTADEITEWIGG